MLGPSCIALPLDAKTNVGKHITSFLRSIRYHTTTIVNLLSNKQQSYYIWYTHIYGSGRLEDTCLELHVQFSLFQ